MAHHRLPRIAGVERAKSGRAKCRHCKEAIAARELRAILSIWQDGRFEPMGFAHMRCARDYLGTTDLEPWLRFAAPDLPAAEWDELRSVLASPAGAPPDGAPSES